MLSVQLVIPQLALVGTPEKLFIPRLREEFKRGGSEVEQMLAGQKWLAKTA